MIVKAANEALCDLLEPVLLVLIVSLGKKDYIIHYSTVHSWINRICSDRSKITNIPYLVDLINHYRYVEGLPYLAFRNSLKNYNTHQDISHPGKLYSVQWRVPIVIHRIAIQGKINSEKNNFHINLFKWTWHLYKCDIYDRFISKKVVKKYILRGFVIMSISPLLYNQAACLLDL
jgi:hypothetical protein